MLFDRAGGVPPEDSRAGREASAAESVRDRATMMGLRGVDYDTARSRIVQAQSADRKSLEDIHAIEGRRADSRSKETEDRISRANEKLAAIERDQTALFHSQQGELRIQGEISDLERRIRMKQSRAARQNLKREIARLQELENEVRSDIKAELEAAATRAETEWKVREQEIKQRTDALERERIRIEAEIQESERRIAPLRDSQVTRTVAGFLIWVGYGSFAAIGSAVAILLNGKASEDSALTSIFAGFGHVDPKQWPWFLLAVVAIFAFIYATLFGNDWLLQRIDSQWRRQAKRKNRDEMSLPTIKIRREGYIQSMAALPYVLIATLLLWFISIGKAPGSNVKPALQGQEVPGRISIDKSPVESNINAQVPGQEIPSKIVNAYLGTVIALLITAVFVMYILKVVELRRKRYGQRWLEAWELGLIPIVLIGGILIAAYLDKQGKPLWGLLSLFMLLSCLAVAYGIVYRGMFKDVDRLRVDRDRCLAEYYDLLSGPEAPSLSDDEAVRTRALLDRYRNQRQELEAIDYSELDPFGDLDASLDRGTFFSSLGRLRSKKPSMPLGIMLSLRVTDVEAAPEEVADLSNKRMALELVRLDTQRLQLTIREMTALVTPAAVTGMKAELGALREQQSVLEASHLAALREMFASHESQLAEFEAAYELGRIVKPLLDGEIPTFPPAPQSGGNGEADHAKPN